MTEQETTPQKFQTPDFFVMAAIFHVGGILPDDVLVCDGFRSAELNGRMQGVAVYNDKDLLPPQADLEPYIIEFKRNFYYVKDLVMNKVKAFEKLVQDEKEKGDKK